MKNLIFNKKYNLNYSIIDQFESGISLQGWEVKSLSIANASIDEAFVIIKKQEAYLMNLYIAPYLNTKNVRMVPARNRKLLLNKSEILKLQLQVKKLHCTIIPVKIYFKNKKIKVLIALSKSKNKADKRQTLKERDLKKEMKKY